MFTELYHCAARGADNGRGCAECPNIGCPRRSTHNAELEAVAEYSGVSARGERDILCVDIGTTTIAFERVHNNTRNSHTAVNRQRMFGADVISRIEAANAGRLEDMRRLILYQLSEGKRRLYPAGQEPDEIVISANTTMVHLLMGYSCRELGVYPFRTECKSIIKTDFGTLSKMTSSGARVTVFPSISGFVGGDIVSGLYMCDFDISEDIELFIDLGTNGEAALGANGRILVTSAAAGPAFEGGKISCGTGSVDGAVCAVDLGEHKITTINNAPPSGICGTGIVELMSELLDNGIADKTGLLREEFFDNGYPLTENIRLTQKDIREIQTAKAAVRAAVEILIKNYGCSYDDIDRVYIAGGFGCRLNIEKACNIGLIPYELKDKCAAVGNSSLGGAVKYGFDKYGDERINELIRMSDEITLAMDADFNDKYVEHMNFGGKMATAITLTGNTRPSEK